MKLPEDEITIRARKKLEEMLERACSPDPNLTEEQKVMVVTGWLNYASAQRLKRLNNRMVK